VKLLPGEAFARAEAKLRRAEKLAGTIPGLAAQQAYLAMYAATQGRLAASGAVANRSHRASQTALHNLYRHDPSDENPGKLLQRAYEWKQIDDYGGEGTVDAEDAAQAVAMARSLIERLRADAAELVDLDNILTDPAIIRDLHERARGWD